MPNLYLRNGVFWYSFTVDSRRIRRSAKTADERLAEDIAIKDEWRHRHAAVHGAEAIITFGEAMRLYVDAGRDRRFLSRLLDLWASTRVKDITPQAIRQASFFLHPKASPATRNRQVITPAVAVINFAAEQGLCSPIRVKRFSEPKPHRRAADRAWVDRFIAHASPHLGALELVMFETAARIGEAINLTWDDVDLAAGTVFFRKTKNGESRTAYISPRAVAMLANLPKDKRKVFGYSGRHSVRTAWEATIKAAGIERLTPHEAGRHAFGTETVVRHGVDIPTAAKLGGWKTHRLLSERYAHPEKERETILRIFGENEK